jgi:DNA-binding MarR family transcriptional regulator
MNKILTQRLDSWKNLVEAYQICTQKYTKLLAEFGFTPSQLDVLFQIETLGEQAKPMHIAEGLLVTKGNITAVTKRLIEQGFISVHPDKTDKRSSLLSMTKKGTRHFKIAKQAAKEFIEAQLAPFTDEEVKLVGELMTKMRFHLESDDFNISLMNIDAMCVLKRKQDGR